MRSARRVKSILVAFCFVLLVSCTTREESANNPVKINHALWFDEIAKAEKKWTASKIKDYVIAGRAQWGWHEHSFLVTVVDGKVVSSKCELGYDGLFGSDYCREDFDPNEYAVSALFEKARHLINIGDEIADPGIECFFAQFDSDNGVPSSMSFDCPEARDEEEEWQIIIFTESP